MNYYPNRLLIRGTNNHVPMYLVISKGSWGGEKKNFSRTRAMPWSKWDGVNHVWRRGAAATESALSHSTTLDAIQKGVVRRKEMLLTCRRQQGSVIRHL